MRKNISAKNEITPAMITAITSMRTSPLRMWVSSWPSTASISASSSAFEQPGGHRDGVLLLVHAARESIERRALHDLELRHRDAARDAEVFQQVVEPRLFLARHVAPAGHHVDQRLVEFVGDHDPQRGADGRERRGLHGIDPGALQQPLQRGVVASSPRPRARPRTPSGRRGRTGRSAAAIERRRFDWMCV